MGALGKVASRKPLRDQGHMFRVAGFSINNNRAKIGRDDAEDVTVGEDVEGTEDDGLPDALRGSSLGPR